MYINETTPVKAKFYNSGGIPVTALFQGNVYLDGMIVKPIRSDEVTVLPRQTVDFLMEFIPQKTGRHTITGRVIYNNKMTSEQSAIMNVNDRPEKKEEQGIKPLIPLFLYLLIVAALILAIRKIRNRKRH